MKVFSSSSCFFFSHTFFSSLKVLLLLLLGRIFGFDDLISPIRTCWNWEKIEESFLLNLNRIESNRSREITSFLGLK